MAKIEIDLADLGLSLDEDGEPSGATLRDLVVKKSVHMIVERYRKDITQAAELELERVVREEVASLVRETLSGPIQRRSSWGEKQGEPTTVLEIARGHLQEFFDKPDRRDSYSRNDKPNSLSGLIGDVVRAALTEELKPAIAEARAAVGEKVREALSTAVVKDLAKS